MREFVTMTAAPVPASLYFANLVDHPVGTQVTIPRAHITCVLEFPTSPGVRYVQTDAATFCVRESRHAILGISPSADALLAANMRGLARDARGGFQPYVLGDDDRNGHDGPPGADAGSSGESGVVVVTSYEEAQAAMTRGQPAVWIPASDDPETPSPDRERRVELE